MKISFLEQFSIAGKATAEVMSLYDSMYGDYKRGKLTYRQQAKFYFIRRSIEKRLQLVEVTPDDVNHDLHEQMAGKYEEGQYEGKYKDLVHDYGVENVDRLKEHRLGGENGNKTAFALIDPETRTVLSAIYVYRSTEPETDNEDPYNHLQGNVYNVLHESVGDIMTIPTSIIFFSISRFLKMSGEGELLISKLHSHLNEQYKKHPNVIFATLSPLRGLKKWCEETYGESDTLNPQQRYNAALRFLIEGGKDFVKRFHLSNGATVGAVRDRANVEDSEDMKEGLGMMVHYIYNRNPSQLLKNAATFHMSKVMERFSGMLLSHIHKEPSFDVLPSQ